MRSVLLIDDDRKLTESIVLNVGEGKYDWLVAHDGEAGFKLVKESQPDVVLCDIRMPKMDGLTLLEQVKGAGVELPVIIMTAYDDMHTTIRAMQLGAFEYITKPIDTSELEMTLDRAIAASKRERHLNRIVTEISTQYQMNNIIGSTPMMKQIFKTIGQVTASRVSVLVQGESGTGKELIAKAIHYNSPMKEAPFTAVNCSAIPEGLFESELFGHEKGAFTGAISTNRGKFEICSDGTLFLDEIGDIPLSMQSKLLRVLQEREFFRVGGSKRIPFEARVIAATHQNLETMVENGKFREDLYYRLNVVRIEVPPLRERKEDIPRLAEYLVDKINRDLDGNIRRIDPDAIEKLERFEFPGNVRELENMLRHAVVMARGEILLPEYLPDPGNRSDSTEVQSNGEHRDLFRFPDSLVPLEEMERLYILHALEINHWKKKQTCEDLGIARTTLDRKLEHYGIKTPKRGVSSDHGNDDQ